MTVSFFDLDAINCLPLLLWAVLILALLFKYKDAFYGISRQPVFLFVIINILIQIVLRSAIIDYITVRDSLLRYMPHLILAALILLFVVLDSLIRDKKRYIALCALVVMTNVFTVSFWTDPYQRNVPPSWVPGVYSEIFEPHEDEKDMIVKTLRAGNTPATDTTGTVVVSPIWVTETMIFYLGDRYLFPPRIDKQIKEKINNTINIQHQVQPEWIVDMLSDLPVYLPGYKTITITSYRDRPDDGTRPELTKHTFHKRNIETEIRLYQRQI